MYLSLIIDVPFCASFAGTDVETLISELSRQSYRLFEIEELRSGVFVNKKGRFIYEPLSSDFQLGPLSVLHSYQGGSKIVLGGIKTDIPPIQGLWDAQPFIVGYDRDTFYKLNPKIFRSPTNLKVLKTKDDTFKFIVASLGDSLKIIHSK